MGSARCGANRAGSDINRFLEPALKTGSTKINTTCIVWRPAEYGGIVRCVPITGLVPALPDPFAYFA